MKKIKFNITRTLLALIAGFLIICACEKEEDYPRTRLFSPVLNESLIAEGNTIIVNMGMMKGAVSYTLEISRDTFKTIDYTIDVDTNFVILDEISLGKALKWNTLYQIRGTAHAEDAQYDSKTAPLGVIRTEKFPSNMTVPTSFDLLDSKVKVRWTTAGQPITEIKVFSLADEDLENPLLEVEVDDVARDSAFLVVGGLTSLTSYWIAIYSGEDLRGWEMFTTIEPFLAGDNVIDLTGIANTSVLADTLPAIPGGSIVLLEGGMTYNILTYGFDKSVTFMKGYSFAPSLPTINCSNNFNVAEGSIVDSIIFKNIAFIGSFDANYVFNIDKSSTIGEIRFENCEIKSLRGIIRMKGGTGTLDKFSIINSVVERIRDYGILAVDVETWSTSNILLENSTFSKCRSFMISRTNSNSLTINNCTLCEAPKVGTYMFRWRTAGNDNVTNGIKIYNTIWGHAWDEDVTGGVATTGIQG
ncbi:MAG: DUF4957 domain-containing protein, partial [Bacteroidales bacterium]|nr:DUF4957 domain-containing protein [Bacteroidales bacterium]